MMQKLRWTCAKHGEYELDFDKIPHCPQCKKESSLNELVEPILKESQAQIKELDEKVKSLEQQLELAEKQQDALYDKIEDFRELVTLLMKVW